MKAFTLIFFISCLTLVGCGNKDRKARIAEIDRELVRLQLERNVLVAAEGLPRASASRSEQINPGLPPSKDKLIAAFKEHFKSDSFIIDTYSRNPLTGGYDAVARVVRMSQANSPRAYSGNVTLSIKQQADGAWMIEEILQWEGASYRVNHILK